MLKKNYLFAGALLSILLLVSACSEEKATQETDTESSTNSTGQLLALSGDTVSKMSGCVLASQYQVGDDIIFRMNAIDPATNKQVTDA